MQERKTVDKRIDGLYITGYSLGEIDKKITTLIQRHGKDAYVKEEFVEGDELYGYEDYILHGIYQKVPESDAQMKDRILAEEYKNAAEEQRERQQLTDLIAKYGVPDAKT